MRVVIPVLPQGKPSLGEVAAEKALPAPARGVAHGAPTPSSPPAVSEPGTAGPLLWHFWSVTNAQEAHKSTCVRHSPVQNNLQFTRNNYHPQIIASTQVGEELGRGREERGEKGREGGREAEHTRQVAAVPRSGLQRGQGSREVVFLN